jgi:hypothetical protein
LNARTTKDRILSPAPLAKLGYPCVGLRIYWWDVRTFSLAPNQTRRDIQPWNEAKIPCSSDTT